ncbi:MAG: bacillithiol transferase BstA [Carnobacterium alterfunditum]
MDERYPIGKFNFEGTITDKMIEEWISEMEDLPASLQDAVRSLTEEQLDTPYRSGGWTVRQVVHHLADSHMNAYVRFKLALTEERPVIKPYEEGEWAELPDYNLPINISISLLEALHKRWTNLLHNLSPADIKKVFIHPDSGEVSVGESIGSYAWHGRHHLAHITRLSAKKAW